MFFIANIISLDFRVEYDPHIWISFHDIGPDNTQSHVGLSLPERQQTGVGADGDFPGRCGNMAVICTALSLSQVLWQGSVSVLLWSACW